MGENASNIRCINFVMQPLDSNDQPVGTCSLWKKKPHTLSDEQQDWLWEIMIGQKQREKKYTRTHFGFKLFIKHRLSLHRWGHTEITDGPMKCKGYKKPSV